MVAISYQPAHLGNYEPANPQSMQIQSAQRGDLNAFNELVMAHQDAVYRQAYWIMGDADAAEDAAQEAFLRAYRSLDSYTGGPFRPWIMRIATNYCLDQLRRRKVRNTIPLEAYDEFDEEIETPTWLRDPSASVEEELIRADQQARIAQSIKRLPADYRAAVILVDIQGMDYVEAAATLGIPLGTFKSRLCRARLQLQKYLKAVL